MSELKYSYDDGRFRTAFLKYILVLNPSWTMKTGRTCVSDAMFVRNALTDSTFSYIMSKPEWSEELEQFLCSFLVLDVLAMRKNPKKDAKGYIRAFRSYFQFIKVVTLIENAKIEKPRVLKGDNNGNT